MIITYVNNKSSSFHSTGVGYTRVLKPGPARRVDPGPGPPGQTRVRPGQFFFYIERRRFGLLKGQNAED